MSARGLRCYPQSSPSPRRRGRGASGIHRVPSRYRVPSQLSCPVPLSNVSGPDFRAGLGLPRLPGILGSLGESGSPPPADPCFVPRGCQVHQAVAGNPWVRVPSRVPSRLTSSELVLRERIKVGQSSIRIELSCGRVQPDFVSRPNLDVPTRARAVRIEPVPMCPVPRATPAHSNTLSRKPPIPIQP